MTRGRLIALGIAVAVLCGSAAFIMMIGDRGHAVAGHSSGIVPLVPLIALIPVFIAARRRRLEKTKNDG